jgi:hypothetical protein
MSFTPTNAYAILAHGGEGHDTFTVPDNCIIVVKSKPGMLEPQQLYEKNLAPLITSTKETVEIYKNPLNHIPKIIEDFGSVAIFKPGDKCPNFIYDFQEEIIEKGDTYVSQCTFGTLKLPLPEEERNLDIIKFQNILEVLTQFTGIYDNIPTLNDYFKYTLRLSTVPKLKDFRTKEHVSSGFVKAPIMFLNMGPILSMTQTQLLDIDGSGKARRPGVYYNFACRNLDSELYKPYSINVPDPNNPGKLKVKYPMNRNEPAMVLQNWVLNTKSKEPGVNNANIHSMRHELLKRAVGEAETKRKQYIRGSKYNMPFAPGGAAAASTRKARKTRKTRRKRRN